MGMVATKMKAVDSPGAQPPRAGTPREPKFKLTAYVPTALHDQLREAAYKRRTSQAALVTVALQSFLNK